MQIPKVAGCDNLLQVWFCNRIEIVYVEFGEKQ